MKVAVAGKGGVGKTTVTSLLAHACVRRGLEVIAVDADPSPCLGAALGFPPELLARLTPIAAMEELVDERTGRLPGGGGFTRLNPRVDDLPERFAVIHGGIRLLALGTVPRGGAGCICGESTLLRRLVGHLLLERDQVVLLDLDAGVEHLGRATADGVDAMLVVVEPTARSLDAAAQVRRLAGDIGIASVFLVGNKVRSESERAFIAARRAGMGLLGWLPADDAVGEADRGGRPLAEVSPRLVAAAAGVLTALEEELARRKPRLGS